MTPDLYAAWLTAGNNLQPVGEWIGGSWTGLVALAVAAAALWVVWWSIHDDTRRADRNDRIAARRAARFEERPEPAEPGSDIGLYLDCIAVFDDCEELDRLRDAIDQHRTGDTNG